nr:zinc finger, CCHC-type [Tanacetum cinerariifolium]
MQKVNWLNLCYGITQVLTLRRNNDSDKSSFLTMLVTASLVAWKLLGSSGVSSGSGVEVVEKAGKNNVVPLRPDTIRLVQNGYSFHGLQSEDPNQHLKDFLKLVDSLDLDVSNRERTHQRLFQFSLCDQASNWLEHLPTRTISTLEDLTTRLVSNFKASQDARLSKFEADFKQKQGEMTNKIDTVLKAINDRMTRALLSDTVKNPKLNVNSTSSVLSARSYPMKGPQCSSHHDTIAKKCKTSEEEGKEKKGDVENINTNPPAPPDPSISFITKKFDIISIIYPRVPQVVLGKPFVEISNMTHDLSLRVVKFTDETNEIAYKMAHKIKQYNSLSDLEKEHMKSVYLRNEEDKRRGVELYLMKRSPGVLRSFIGRLLDDDLASHHMFLLHY